VKLVAYTDATEIGGAEVSLGNLLAALPAEYAVSVIGVDRDTVETIAGRRPGAVRRVVLPVRRKHDVLRIVRHIVAFQRERPAVVHVSMNTPWACQYGIAAALLTPGARVVLVEQSLFPTESRLQRAFKRFVSQRVSAHVAVGRKSAVEIERLSNLEPGSVRTIYNGVKDPGTHRPGPERATKVVGAVGRLDRVKGHDVLLEALALLPGVELLLVGDGPERAALESRARRLDLATRLTITGWVGDPGAQLPSMDVVALPSRLESFPLAVVEAMLAERPVVASDVGSVSEAVVDGQTGLLVPSEDPVALAAAIRKLLDDPGLRLELAAAGRARALELFTSEAMANAFTSLYQEVLAARRAHAARA
jgi:glycosyltransferase involved in cell wall biosynthesis